MGNPLTSTPTQNLTPTLALTRTINLTLNSILTLTLSHPGHDIKMYPKKKPTTIISTIWIYLEHCQTIKHKIYITNLLNWKNKKNNWKRKLLIELTKFKERIQESEVQESTGQQLRKGQTV